MRLYLQVICFLLIGIFAYSKGLPPDMQRISDSLKHQLVKTKIDTIRFELQQKLISIYLDSDPAYAKNLIEDGINKTSIRKYPAHRFAFLNALMQLNNGRGEYLKTLEVANRADSFIAFANSPRTIAGYYYSLGNALNRTGNFGKAAESFNKGIVIGKKYKLVQVEVLGIMNLGLLYEKQNRFNEMRAHLIKALTIATENNLQSDIAIVKFNLSFLEGKVNNFGKAIEYLQEIIPYYEEKNNSYALGLCYANLSDLHYQLKKNDQALIYARKSMDTRVKINDMGGLARVYYILGKIHLEEDKFDSAYYFSNKGIELSKKLNLVVDIRDGYRALAEIYEKQKKYAEALIALKEHLSWKDSLLQSEKNKQLQDQFNLFKWQYSDSLSQLAREEIKKEQLKSSYWSITSIIGLLGCLLFFILYNVQKKEISTRKLNSTDISGLTNNSLNTIPEELLVRENTNTNVIETDKLLEQIHFLQSELRKKSSQDLQRLQKFVRESGFNNDAYWIEFMQFFAKIYPHFFEKLKTQFPLLSQNEMRICALTKLNLSLLDIANVLNITTESVRKARYRIYKKINLNSDQEFADMMILF